MEAKVLGLLGRVRSGKTTAARHMAQKYGAKTFSCAAPLKRLAKRVMDFSDEQLYGTQEQKEAIDPRYGMSARDFLVRLGDGCRQELTDRLWVRRVFADINKSGALLCVIDDIRYQNEAEELRERGFRIIKLMNPEAQKLDYPSERSVDEVPAYLIDSVIISRPTEGSVDLLSQLDIQLRRLGLV